MVARYVLHDYVYVGVVLHKIQCAHDVRMVKLPTYFELLAHQVHQDLVVRNSELIDNLDRYWRLPHTVLSLQHEPELACAELFFEIVDLADVIYAFEISRVH